MKKISLCYVVFLMLVMPTVASAQSLAGYQPVFKGALKAWAGSFDSFKLSDFKLTRQVDFENKNSRHVATMAALYPVYKKALCVSPDGTRVLDIYSYLLLEKRKGRLISTGSDVEQGIWLGDVRGLRWRQIAYYGYMQRVQEVCWVDEDTFMLAAVRFKRAGEQVPVVLVGELGSQRLAVFECANAACRQKPGGFVSPKLLALGVRTVLR